MQSLFEQEQEEQKQTGPRVVATVPLADGVYEEVLAGAISRTTAVAIENYPLSKYKAVKGTMYRWIETEKGSAKRQRGMHSSKDPRRSSEGEPYNDTTYTTALVLVRIRGGEKDGHVEYRRPSGYQTRETLAQFLDRYDAALDEYHRQKLTALLNSPRMQERGETWIS